MVKRAKSAASLPCVKNSITDIIKEARTLLGFEYLRIKVPNIVKKYRMHSNSTMLFVVFTNFQPHEENSFDTASATKFPESTVDRLEGAMMMNEFAVRIKNWIDEKQFKTSGQVFPFFESRFRDVFAKDFLIEQKNLAEIQRYLLQTGVKQAANPLHRRAAL